jgi:hypothetical protein
MVEAVTWHKWPTDGIPFAGVRIAPCEIAVRIGVATQKWDVDGLGPAIGFGFRAQSGRVYLLQQLELVEKHYGVIGSDVYVDATDFLKTGLPSLVSDVIQALELSSSDLVVTADASTEKLAKQLVAKLA